MKKCLMQSTCTKISNFKVNGSLNFLYNLYPQGHLSVINRECVHDRANCKWSLICSLCFCESNFMTSRQECSTKSSDINISHTIAYDRIQFPTGRTWKVAVGIHPEQAQRVTEQVLDHLQSLICYARVHTVSELGLDHSVPSTTYDRQERLLHRILQMGVSGRVLILHLWGDSHTDPSGTRPSKIVRLAIRKNCSHHQRIHVHCCLLGTEEVAAWQKAFPHVYFGYTAITAWLEMDQRKAR